MVNIACHFSLNSTAVLNCVQRNVKIKMPKSTCWLCWMFWNSLFFFRPHILSSACIQQYIGFYHPGDHSLLPLSLPLFLALLVFGWGPRSIAVENKMHQIPSFRSTCKVYTSDLLVQPQGFVLSTLRQRHTRVHTHTPTHLRSQDHPSTSCQWRNMVTSMSWSFLQKEN